MASLQTLRDKGGVIVAAVIALALISFVLGDLLTSGGVLFGQGNNNLGEIQNKDISREEYLQSRHEVEEYLKVNQGVQTLGADQSQMIDQMTWQNLITRNAVSPALLAEGLTVSAEELQGIISSQFEPAQLQQLLMQIENDQTGTLRAYWDYLTESYHNQAQVSKYVTLLQKGNFVTASEADFMAQLQGAEYKVRFVGQKLSTIADSTVAISDSEIEKYYEANKDKWQRTPTRVVNYVTFDVLPSKEDYAKASKVVSDLDAKFEATSDIAQFVNLNSDGAINQISGQKFDTRYYKEGELPAQLNSFAFGEDNSGVMFSEMEANEYTLARVAGTKVLPDSLELSVIILDPSSTALADSLNKVIVANPAKFTEIAAQFSQEPSVETNQGDFGMLDPQSLPNELSSPILEMNEGEVKLITFPQSIMIAKVGKKVGMGEKTQVGIITKMVLPSQATRNATYNKASAFLTAANNGDFATVAADDQLSSRQANLAVNAWELPGFKNSREVVRWAYNAEVGDVSHIMEFGDTYVVATLSGVVTEGNRTLAEVKDEIKRTLMLEKKGEMIAQTMTGGVDQLASKLGLEVQENDKVTFNTAVASSEFGTDFAFAGGVAALKAGETSKPIVGTQAVYVVEVVEVNSAPMSTDMVKRNIEMQQQMILNQRVSQEIIDKFEISDERYRVL